jgi:hypothetical protein
MTHNCEVYDIRCELHRLCTEVHALLCFFSSVPRYTGKCILQQVVSLKILLVLMLLVIEIVTHFMVLLVAVADKGPPRVQSWQQNIHLVVRLCQKVLSNCWNTVPIPKLSDGSILLWDILMSVLCLLFCVERKQLLEEDLFPSCSRRVGSQHTKLGPTVGAICRWLLTISIEDGTDRIFETVWYFFNLMCIKRSETKHSNPFPNVGLLIGFWLDAAENNAIYFMFCRPCILRKLVDNKPTWRTNFLKYIYLSITLYMFRALCAHHQERYNCTNTTSVLVIPF